MINVSDIEFVDTDTKKIKSNVITIYESLTDRTLAQGDPVRLFLESIASIIAQQKAVINFTGKMNLLAYAKADYLDHLGVLVGTERIPASAAQATAKITLSAVQSSVIVVPKGTRITAGDNIFFATTEQRIIAIGDITATVTMECTTAGIIGNGYLPGQIKTIVDPIPYVQSIINTTESTGGADIEDDDSFRLRINEAPESFSCAGPDGAYKYWAKSASALIADVAVISDVPGNVEIVPLLKNGEIPTSTMLTEISSICNDKKIRPLTDNVNVSAPSVVDFDVTATYYIDSSNAAEVTEIQTAVSQAVSDYVLWQKSKLGRDINPSELIRQMVNAGAKRISVMAPTYTAVTKKQVAIANTPTITFGGVDDD